jgi:hypothetical protein
MRTTAAGLFDRDTVEGHRVARAQCKGLSGVPQSTATARDLATV